MIKVLSVAIFCNACPKVHMLWLGKARPAMLTASWPKDMAIVTSTSPKDNDT